MKTRLPQSPAATLMVLAALNLLGCENDAASFQDPAREGQTLTLIREQRLFWDDKAEVALVVARFPDCQRRHKLGASAPEDARLEVHRAEGRAYLIDAQDTWYFADSETCELEEVEAPTAGEEGKILGAFYRKDDRLSFVPSESEPGEK